MGAPSGNQGPQRPHEFKSDQPHPEAKRPQPKGTEMYSRRIAMLLALAALMVGVATGARSATTAQISPRLEAALVAPVTEEAAKPRLAVWVNFTERNLAGSALSEALRDAESQLPPRLRERRAAMGTPVDAADLPLVRDWIDAVIATGAEARRESRWLNAASFDATAAQIRVIAMLPYVRSVDLVGQLRGSEPLEITPEQQAAAEAAAALAAGQKSLGEHAYGASRVMLDQINAVPLHDQGLSGNGVTIAIFDTGFHQDHESLENIDVVAAWDFVNEDPYVYDQKNDQVGHSDHGTQVLGSLVGYREGSLVGPAYGASVILAKTEDITGETVAEEDNWIAALEWSVDLGADIVSSSIGYYSWYQWSDMDGGTAPITIAADMAAARGTVVIVGVGNMRYVPDWPHILAPADGFNVISVGSSDINGYLEPTSAPGPTYDGRTKPDVLALGFGNLVPVPWTTDIYYFVWGNDYATPLVAGAAALMLEQDPSLTPMQIREALRMTASRSLLPDNDYGWGQIDALAASRYYSPVIAHEPIGNQPAGTGAFDITVEITSRLPLVPGSQGLYYRVDGRDWFRRPLSPAGGDIFEGTIPPQGPGRTIEYYFTATNEWGRTVIWPDPEREPIFTFGVGIGTDTVPPVITHSPLTDQAVANWPPRIVAQVQDEGTIDRVLLFYTVDGSPLQPPVDMTEGPDGWAVDFPQLADPMLSGHTMTYMVAATDSGVPANMTYVGPFPFDVVEHRGSVLMIMDRFDIGMKSDETTADPRGAVQVLSAEKTRGDDMVQWMVDAGFRVEQVDAEDFNSSYLAGRDVVFYTSGNHLGPLAYAEVPRGILNWVDSGGLLLVEGGDIAYTVQGNPALADFAANVLHIDGFLTDDGTEFWTRPDMADHAILHRPHKLPSPLRVNVPAGVYDWAAADVVQVTDEATVVMQTGYGAHTAGISVFDDDTGPMSGQIVYLPFDMNYLTDQDGRAVIVNALTYLTSRESEGPSSIGGRVQLAGQNDHSGVALVTGRGISITTGPDGSYEFAGLWGGTFTVTASREGFGTVSRTVTIVEGETVGDLDFYLVPVTVAEGAVRPYVSIPDDDPEGVDSTIGIGVFGDVAGIRVGCSIRHYSIGHLVVTLTSPTGRTVTLHDRNGGVSDDLEGEWPTTLWVDGPGDLDDFLGEDAQGHWTLNVSDHAFGATGQLRTWSLHLLVAQQGIAGAEPVVKAQTRIVGNTPNPFNPRTTISFEVARSGPVRLDIYDLRGRLVARLLDGETPAGAHSVVWDGPEAASGIYFARLTADGTTTARKMTLLR